MYQAGLLYRMPKRGFRADPRYGPLGLLGHPAQRPLRLLPGHGQHMGERVAAPPPADAVPPAPTASPDYPNLITNAARLAGKFLGAAFTPDQPRPPADAVPPAPTASSDYPGKTYAPMGGATFPVEALGEAPDWWGRNRGVIGDVLTTAGYGLMGGGEGDWSGGFTAGLNAVDRRRQNRAAEAEPDFQPGQILDFSQAGQGRWRFKGGDPRRPESWLRID